MLAICAANNNNNMVCLKHEWQTKRGKNPITYRIVCAYLEWTASFHCFVCFPLKHFRIIVIWTLESFESSFQRSFRTAIWYGWNKWNRQIREIVKKKLNENGPDIWCSMFLTCKCWHLSFGRRGKHDRMLAIPIADSNVGPLKSSDWHRSNLVQHRRPPMTTSSPIQIEQRTNVKI